ncbi:hypothetical protein ABZU32_03895 [Sphaerisporangium sp. NPDC005288]|uniref:hypothetical protein n=1 Tax=Sphaerisporangium sp. NPDC005288 TaxID=3155114 RepID=UPI0033B87ACE
MGKKKDKSRKKARKGGKSTDSGSDSSKEKAPPRKDPSDDEARETGSAMEESQAEDGGSDDDNYEIGSDYDGFDRRSPRPASPSTRRSSSDDDDRPVAQTGGTLVRTKQQQVVRAPAPAPALPASRVPDLVAYLTSLPRDLAAHLLSFVNFTDLLNVRALNQQAKKLVDGLSPGLTPKALGPLDLRQFWIRLVRRVVPGTSPLYVLSVAREMPAPADPKLWRDIGEFLRVPYTEMPEIVAELAWQRGEADDEAILNEVRELAAEAGGDPDEVLERYENAIVSPNPLTLLKGARTDPGTAETGRVPGAEERRLKAAVHERLRLRHAAQAEEAAAAGGGREYRAELLKGKKNKREKLTSEQRSLDRLAWVLQHLQDSRECVAVASAGNELRLWANTPDDEMARDLNDLLEVARAQTAGAEEDLNDQLQGMWNLLRQSGLDVRDGEPTLQQWKAAERRLRKTITFLAELEATWGKVQTSAQTLQFLDGKVHAEVQFADDLLRLRAELKAKMATLPEDQRAAYQERLRLIDEARVAVGISKLCCLKCYLAIGAVISVEKLSITISGTHYRTYDWPMPPSLASSEPLLRAYLNLPAKPTKAADKELDAALKDPAKRAVIVKAINTYIVDGYLTPNGYISSEDERGLEFTFYDQPPEEPADDGPEESVEAAQDQPVAPADEEREESSGGEEVVQPPKKRKL